MGTHEQNENAVTSSHDTQKASPGVERVNNLKSVGSGSLYLVFHASSGALLKRSKAANANLAKKRKK